MNRSYLSCVADQLWTALAEVVHINSLLSLAVLALFLGLVERLALLPFDLALLATVAVPAVWATYFYLVMRNAANGSRRLPKLSDYRDAWDALIHPLLQGVVVGLWYWGPLLVCVRRTIGLTVFVRQLQLRSMVFFRQHWLPAYVLLGAEIIYLPAALIAASVSRRALPLLDPTYGLRRVWSVPGPFAVTFTALQPLVLLGFLMSTASALLQQAMPVPVAAPVMGHLLCLWVPLAQARLLGRFAHRWADALKGKRS